MGDKKWCPQHGYPLPCDKCGMPSKTLEELIDDRIASLKEMVGLFEDGYSKELERGTKELEWVRRMMEDVRTQVKNCGNIWHDKETDTHCPECFESNCETEYAETTIIDDNKYCVDCGEEIKDEVER